jgi:3'(2'), 5'-bisphosphate nucleotidase
MQSALCVCHTIASAVSIFRFWKSRASPAKGSAMIDQLITLAREAGEAILTVYASAQGAQSREKGDGSPVTVADEMAEAVILAGLSKIAPDISVVAEESVAAGRVPPPSARFFLVDPLDGTKEFINRNGEFTVNIALIEDGLPVMGVVYLPTTGVVYAGEVGKGATRDGAEIRASQPSGAIKVVASRSHMSDETSTWLKRFDVSELVSAGSSLKFCRVAEGAADLYPRLGRTMEWDTAAGDAVLRAAGGRVCTLDGADLIYGKRDQTNDSDFANPWFVATGGFDPFGDAA